MVHGAWQHTDSHPCTLNPSPSNRPWMLDVLNLDRNRLFLVRIFANVEGFVLRLGVFPISTSYVLRGKWSICGWLVSVSRSGAENRLEGGRVGSRTPLENLKNSFHALQDIYLIFKIFENRVDSSRSFIGARLFRFDGFVVLFLISDVLIPQNVSRRELFLRGKSSCWATATASRRALTDLQGF